MRTAMRTSTLVVALSILAALTSLSTAVSANAGPVKLIPTTHYGYKVDKTSAQNACVIGGGDECQAGATSQEPGGFENPEGVATSPTGDIYVTDQTNHRVQELTPTGEFVLMFGKEVNATTHGDVCTAEEVKVDGVKCKAGLSGSSYDALAVLRSIAVDQSTGNIYVQDWENWRIDEYTPEGQFILTIGKDVNKTKELAAAPEAETNVCTAESKDICQAGLRSALESTEKGAFDFEQNAGDLLTVGNTPEHLLYVGDGHRIQEIASNGEWKGEVRLPQAIIAHSPTSSITTLAVDASSQTAYVGYNHENAIRRLDLLSGTEVGSPLTIEARQSGNNVVVNGLALGPTNELAVASLEGGAGVGALHEPFGILFDGSTGEEISVFGVPGGQEVENLTPVTFDQSGNLYMVVIGRQEVDRYIPLGIGEVSTGVATCKEGAEQDTSVNFNCVLNGTVDPYDVPDTEIFFEWGKATAGGSCPSAELNTNRQAVATEEAVIPVDAQVDDLRPNQTFCFALAGLDENVKLPERIVRNTNSFSTNAVKPKSIGQPRASFVTFDAAVLHGELNPENALTEYFFEYAIERKHGEKPLVRCPGIKRTNCSGVMSTAVLESALYGTMGTTAQVVGLQPNTPYDYRLSASNEAGESSPGLEAEFTTSQAPVVEAVTLPASAITSSGALATGTVTPDGEQATYTFELGVYEGANTNYSPVASGATGAGVEPEKESDNLTNLQPSTTYAYRISVNSGYGESRGAPAIFSTMAVPASAPISPVTLLEAPLYKFPTPPTACKRGYTRDGAGVCVKATAKKVKAVRKGKRRKRGRDKGK
jgi:hypothetical protein